MYDVIIVGTDGSDTAAVAVEHATRLAASTGATLHIVHVYQTVSTGQIAMAATAGAATGDFEEANAGSAADSERICQRAATNAQREGVKVETHARPGDAGDVLVGIAEEVGADLLVIGNRGMSGVRRFVLGSVPNKVSHHCPCSLLIVDTTRRRS
jgi:nucleotide-binding universal stress UspA family protein